MWPETFATEPGSVGQHLRRRHVRHVRDGGRRAGGPQRPTARLRAIAIPYGLSAGSQTPQVRPARPVSVTGPSRPVAFWPAGLHLAADHSGGQRPGPGGQESAPGQRLAGVRIHGVRLRLGGAGLGPVAAAAVFAHGAKGDASAQIRLATPPPAHIAVAVLRKVASGAGQLRKGSACQEHGSVPR